MREGSKQWVMFWGTKPSEMINTLPGTERQDEDRPDYRESHVPRNRELTMEDDLMEGQVQPPPTGGL